MSEYKFFPYCVVWESTFACNMRCLHCGTSAGKRRPDELTTEEALKMVDDCASLGADNITLSGGEPLMREDWLVVARHIKERGMRPMMISNGLLIDEEKIREFESVPMTMVGVSLDGTEKTHNYIRQRAESFAGAVNALKLMANNSAFGCCAVTQVSNTNLNELDQIRQIIKDTGCRLWRIQLCTATGRMKDNRELVLSLDNYPAFLRKIIQFQKLNEELRIDVGENIGYYGQLGTQLWPDSPYLGCFAGTRILGIESNGNIKGCLSMPEDFVEGNIREKSLIDIWNNPDGFAYNRQFTKDTASGFCHDCKYLPLCRGGCTTTSFSASGCRADNPYCIYRIEQDQGIAAPPDGKVVTELLARFNPPPKEAG
jgi:radical SAM protein with 4Fe4S-binding SPASM domain